MEPGSEEPGDKLVRSVMGMAREQASMEPGSEEPGDYAGINSLIDVLDLLQWSRAPKSPVTGVSVELVSDSVMLQWSRAPKSPVTNGL